MDSLSLWVVFLTSATAAGLQLVRARQSRNRRWFHLVAASSPLYFSLLYGLIIIGAVPAPSLMAAHWSRLGITLAMFIVGAYCIAYWKDNNEH